MRIRTLLLVAFVAVVAVVVVAGLYLGGRGFSAHEKPSWFEELLARNARSIATPAKAKRLQNPIQITQERLASARAHWVDHCALCHGLEGSGNTAIGRNLYPPAPDLRDAQTQRLADGELFYIINNGVRLTGMPAWGGLHSDEETWELVAFLRQLPHLSAEDLQQLQRLAETGGAHHQSGEAGHSHGQEAMPHKH